jgi:hypothetical protein
MREIAELIVRRVRECRPLRCDTAVAAFEEEARRDAKWREFPFSLTFWRVSSVRRALALKYVSSVNRDLSQGYRVFEANAGAVRGEAARNATQDMRRFSEACTRALGVEVRVWHDVMALEIAGLTGEIAGASRGFVELRRLKLGQEFKDNCSAALTRIVKEENFGWWPKWTPQLETEWMARFCSIVHFNDLPPKMQRSVNSSYYVWRLATADRLPDELKLARIRRIRVLTICIGLMSMALYRVINQSGPQKCNQPVPTPRDLRWSLLP